MFLETSKKPPKLSCTKKASTADVSFNFWLITIWLFLKSPNSPSASLKAKAISVSPSCRIWAQAMNQCWRLMWKDANSLPPLALLCPSYRDPQTERLCFAERNTVCAAEPHLSLCQSALCICSAGARFASARQFFKRKALAFQISVRICFSKSARQAEQIHSHLYWAWT